MECANAAHGTASSAARVEVHATRSLCSATSSDAIRHTGRFASCPPPRSLPWWYVRGCRHSPLSHVVSTTVVWISLHVHPCTIVNSVCVLVVVVVVRVPHKSKTTPRRARAYAHASVVSRGPPASGPGPDGVARCGSGLASALAHLRVVPSHPEHQVLRVGDGVRQSPVLVHELQKLDHRIVRALIRVRYLVPSKDSSIHSAGAPVLARVAQKAADAAM